MKHAFRILAACGAIFLAGCSSTPSFNVSPTIERYQAPDPQSGYIAGTFSASANVGRLAFALVNAETGSEWILPVGEIHYLQVDQKMSLRMIPVPPGKYRLAYWTNYDAMGQRGTPFDFPAGTLSATLFDVPAGGIAFIGNFAMPRTDGPDFLVPIRLRRFKQVPISPDDARKSLAAVHPGFLKLSFSCQPCTGNGALAR